MPSNPSHKRPAAFLFILAGLVTLGYIISVTWLISKNWLLILDLKPNELGDFLAGIFAPMVFMWLIVGYLQQSQELRYSARALWIQGEELRRSVEQQRLQGLELRKSAEHQRILAESSRRQAEIEMLRFRSMETNSQDEKEVVIRKSQPIFESSVELSEQKEVNYILDVNIFNVGSECSNLSIILGNKLLRKITIFPRGANIHCKIEYPKMKFRVNKFKGRVEYVDILGVIRSEALVFKFGKFITH